MGLWGCWQCTGSRDCWQSSVVHLLGVAFPLRLGEQRGDSAEDLTPAKDVGTHRQSQKPDIS